MINMHKILALPVFLPDLMWQVLIIYSYTAFII
jgi:hypothetical protein